MIVLLISSLVLALGFSLESSASYGGQGRMMSELNEKSGRETLDGIPEEETEEEFDTEYFDSGAVGDTEEKDMLGDLACLPAELRILIYRQYFFGEGTSCHVRRSTRNIRSNSPDESEDDKLASRPCMVAHSLASNIDGISLLQTNKQM